MPCRVGLTVMDLVQRQISSSHKLISSPRTQNERWFLQLRHQWNTDHNRRDGESQSLLNWHWKNQTCYSSDWLLVSLNCFYLIFCKVTHLLSELKKSLPNLKHKHLSGDNTVTTASSFFLLLHRLLFLEYFPFYLRDYVQIRIIILIISSTIINIF